MDSHEIGMGVGAGASVGAGGGINFWGGVVGIGSGVGVEAGTGLVQPVTNNTIINRRRTRPALIKCLAMVEFGLRESCLYSTYYIPAIVCHQHMD
jgi:hypothetical protein